MGMPEEMAWLVVGSMEAGTPLDEDPLWLLVMVGCALARRSV